MSKLRMFQKARHAVRLPALPRQVVMLVLLINIIGFGLVMPYIIGEWVNRTMRETAGQAAVLAQLTDMQDLTGRRAMRETRALRMAGFDVRMSGQENPSRVWLVAAPRPQKQFDEFDLTHAGIFDGIAMGIKIMLRPADRQFSIYDGSTDNGRTVRAFASYGVWQEYLGAIMLRIFWPLSVSVWCLSRCLAYFSAAWSCNHWTIFLSAFMAARRWASMMLMTHNPCWPL
jgi:hypothetical protein